jgi:hypothetical protein
MNDPLYPNFQRLVLQTSYAAVLGEAVLAVGSSPKDAISHLAGQVELNAHTFDWWIPTGRHPRILDQTSMRVVQHKVFSASSSGSSGALPHIASGGVSGAITNLSEGALGWQVGWQDGLQFGWLDGTPDFVGEHRDMATASVQLNYRLDWSGDHLSVLIENRPQDRNYVVFLVIEETFGSVEPDEQPPKVLHSAFPIAINGQLTRVPRTFFDQEKAARDRVGAIMSDFARHYSVSRQPGHGDPVIDAMRPGEVNTPNGLLRLISAARQIEPGLLERAVRAHRGVF